LRFVIVLLLFAACSSPALRYGGVAPVRVVVEGARYDVYRLGAEAQAIRVSMELLPRKAQSFARALAAIEAATGCKVVEGSLAGDQALVQAELDCT